MTGFLGAGEREVNAVQRVGGAVVAAYVGWDPGQIPSWEGVCRSVATIAPLRWWHTTSSPGASGSSSMPRISRSRGRAGRWLQTHQLRPTAVRIDIIAVLFDRNTPPTVDHVRGAA